MNLTSTLNLFDELPASAHVRLPVVMALCSASASTVWRWSRKGRLPRPIHIDNTTLWNVGALRLQLHLTPDIAAPSPTSDPAGDASAPSPTSDPADDASITG
jgi:hypothetical protein